MHATELVDRVARAAQSFRLDRRLSLRQWLLHLFGSLEALGVEDGLSSDPAGLQLVDYLHRLERELTSSSVRFSFGEWRSWLDRQLESAEFRDNGVSSPVIFTQLSLTRLRRFDAVVLIGCDAAHLPGTDQQGAFFSESVRAQLGLPTSRDRVAQIVDDLRGLLCRSDRVLVTWQTMRDTEPNLPSALFERLAVFHRLSWGTGLEDQQLPLTVIDAQVAPPHPVSLPTACLRPAPAFAPERLPERISASGYNSLVACPYQFYGRYVLGLRETEEVRESMEKRDYGDYVHRILRRFHAQFPVCSDVSRAQLEVVLEEISEDVFRDATEASYLNTAWALRWRATQSDYLDWQLAREREGWRFHAAEAKRSIAITLPDGAQIMLEGRLDRIDVRGDQANTGYAVIDYKTRAHDHLRRMASEPGEDVQLPVYVCLVEGDVEEAFYLAIDNAQVRKAALERKCTCQRRAGDRAVARVDFPYSRRCALYLPRDRIALANGVSYRGCVENSTGMTMEQQIRRLNARALDPGQSVVIEACAGSGKTWLLVSRIVRLLLADVRPSEILAITFTRKAAQEMQARLHEWLHFLAIGSDDEVEQFLRDREVPQDQIGSMLPRARSLFESFLSDQPGITISTFHGWFLQLLKRAPLAAGAANGASLVDQVSSLIDEAWESFAQELQREPDGQLAGALSWLFERYGLVSTRALLTTFVQKRAEWWAYTRSQPDPVKFALENLHQEMPVAPDADVVGEVFSDSGIGHALTEYADLLEGNQVTGDVVRALQLRAGSAKPTRLADSISSGPY